MRFIRFFSLFILFGLLFSACSKPESSIGEWAVIKEYSKTGVTFSISLSSLEINAAGTLQIKMESIPGDKELIIPRLPDNPGGFILERVKRLPVEISDEGNAKYIAYYYLKPALPGEYFFPSMTLEIRDRDSAGISSEIITDPFIINVVSVIPQNTEGLDIKDIINPELPDKADYTILIISIAAGTVFVVLLIIFIFKRRKGPVIPSPYEEALLAMEEIQKSGYYEDGKVKKYYRELSFIIRRYISRRFDISGLKKNTSELIISINNDIDIDNTDKDIIRTISPLFDAVKFAEYKPVKTKTEEIVARLILFIKNTREKEVEEKG